LNPLLRYLIHFLVTSEHLEHPLLRASWRQPIRTRTQRRTSGVTQCCAGNHGCPPIACTEFQNSGGRGSTRAPIRRAPHSRTIPRFPTQTIPRCRIAAKRNPHRHRNRKPFPCRPRALMAAPDDPRVEIARHSHLAEFKAPEMALRWCKSGRIRPGH
jgi:hypothetical protein